MKYEIKTEIVEAPSRPLSKEWTLEPMQNINVEQTLFDILQEEIEKEMIAAGHGTRADRDQKIIDQILQAHKEIVHKDFDDAKEVI